MPSLCDGFHTKPPASAWIKKAMQVKTCIAQTTDKESKTYVLGSFVVLYRNFEIWYNIGVVIRVEETPMFTERSGKQNKLEMVILEELVPQDHLLRKIDKAIDFSFINKICKPYYCENNGRPAIEPEVLFRMLFIGYLYGIRSEIRLLKEIEVNVAYRWFIGYTKWSSRWFKPACLGFAVAALDSNS